MNEFLYRVVGGEFTDMTFQYLAGKPELYGPFATYDMAYDCWRGESQRNIDDCHHKLYVVKEEIFERTNATTIVYWGDDLERNGREFTVVDERARQYCIRDKNGKIWLAKVCCEATEKKYRSSS